MKEFLQREKVMEHKSRKTTCAILRAIDDGVLDYKSVAEAALIHMSEAEVTDMAETYGWDSLLGLDEEEE